MGVLRLLYRVLRGKAIKEKAVVVLELPGPLRPGIVVGRPGAGPRETETFLEHELRALEGALDPALPEGVGLAADSDVLPGRATEGGHDFPEPHPRLPRMPSGSEGITRPALSDRDGVNVAGEQQPRAAAKKPSGCWMRAGSFLRNALGMPNMLTRRE